MTTADGARPLIGVTMGDPRGIGPEVTRAALSLAGDGARWRIYGEPSLYDGIEASFISPVGSFPERDAVERAAADLASGDVDGVVTAPVSKACFQGEFPGHTELFADRLAVEDFAMLLTGPELSVVPVTTHAPLRDVADQLTTEALHRIGLLVNRWLPRGLDVQRPRLAFSGLNPHCGDGGLFGDEESTVIQPAIDALKAQGVDASGPWSPDTVFHHARSGRFDVVVCPYHDQALIPFKLLHFSDGVNVTIGLPRPRTSPDHGPAYDLVGTGLADPTSMVRAVEMAIRLADTEPVMSRTGRDAIAPIPPRAV
ncbi:MAG: 4-hydroxythreonine-4-phosphate dehydrogenase PdxA [Myxococcota bacterium]|nr:4-hydroxythreonine-4-phosphate dehydrogenase PdxA [Myxococcota bacterium]